MVKCNNKESCYLRKPSDPTLARIISSSFGSLLTALAVTPLDVVKVRQQASVAEPLANTLGQCSRCGVFEMNCGLIHGEKIIAKNISPHFSACEFRGSLMVLSSSPTVYATNQFPSSIFRGIGHIFRNEGVAGIYSGLAPTLVMAIPATVLYFTAYDELKDQINQRCLMNPTMTPAFAGMAARILASAATSPFELVRTIMQSNEVGLVNGSRPNTYESIRMLHRNGGFLSLWRGLEPTLWRDVPFSAIYWYTLEKTRIHLEEIFPSSSPLTASIRDLIGGASAGMLAATVTTPFDVVKTRRQVYSAVEFETPDHSAAAGNGSTPRVLREILREEGIQGAFRGLSARMLKIAPACAIMIATYESGKRYLTPALRRFQS